MEEKGGSFDGSPSEGLWKWYSLVFLASLELILGSAVSNTAYIPESFWNLLVHDEEEQILSFTYFL